MNVDGWLVDYLSVESTIGFECRECGLLFTAGEACPECGTEVGRPISPFLGM